MGATYKSHIPEFKQRLNAAIERSMKDSAEAFRLAIQAKIADGFTSGQFTTGRLAAGEPLVSNVSVNEKGNYEVSVGTNDLVLIAWTLGHYNVFTKRFERVDTFTESASQLTPVLQDIARAHLRQP